jgi:hypothetical protein
MKVTLLLLAGIVVLAVEGGRRRPPPEDGKWKECNWCTDGILCTRMGCGDDVCWHNGVSYKVGQSFLNECNRCTCGADDMVACTKMMCHDDLAACSFRGFPYFAGELLKAGPGGKICQCKASGRLSCGRGRKPKKDKKGKKPRV